MNARRTLAAGTSAAVGDGVEHHALERALAQFPGEQPDEELLLVRGGGRQQGGEDGVAPGRRPGAARCRRARSRAWSTAATVSDGVGGGGAAQPRQGAPADAQPALPRLARQPGGDRLDLVPVRPAQQRRRWRRPSRCATSWRRPRRRRRRRRRAARPIVAAGRGDAAGRPGPCAWLTPRPPRRDSACRSSPASPRHWSPDAIEVVDLTAPLSAETPVIQLPPQFAQTAPFELEELSRYDDRGPAWYWNNFRTGEHTGTHFDAPNHWVTGQDGDDVASVPARAADRAGRRPRLLRAGRRGPRLPARGRARRGVGGDARPAARRRLAALPHRLGRPVGLPAGLPERRRHRPAHARRLARPAPAGWPRRRR